MHWEHLHERDAPITGTPALQISFLFSRTNRTTKQIQQPDTGPCTQYSGPRDPNCQFSRRRGADDRQLDRARSSARLRGQKESGVRCVGRSRGGLTTKIHARVDAKGRPIRLLILPGNDHDVTAAEALLDGLEPCAIVIADQGYDADSVRTYIRDQGAIPNIPNRGNREGKYLFRPR